MDYFNLIVAIVVAPVTVVAALAYVSRVILSRLLARDIETFKHQLLRDFEVHKRNLDALQFERQTKFSLMHERRAEVIATLHGMLLDARIKCALMTSSARAGRAADKDIETEADDKIIAAGDAITATQDYFNRHRIYLSESTVSQVGEVMNHLVAPLMEADRYWANFKHDWRNDHKVFDVWMRFPSDLDPVLVALEKDFRAILGVAD